MAQNYNSDTSKELREAGSIQVSKDTIPSKINDSIQPVIEVNPRLLKYTKCLYCAEISASTGGSPGATLVTTSLIKDTFITSIYLTYSSTAACDDTVQRIRVTDEYGTVVYPLALWKATLTATSGWDQVSFNPPLKLKKGTIIYHFHNFSAGASTTYINIVGYENDVSTS